MLRITKVSESPSLVTMKLEGRITTDWASLLEHECMRVLQERRELVLDFSEVRFVDDRAVEVLGKMSGKKIRVINCCDLIKDLLRGGQNR
ncbi:MAG: STAS domain-containing protein [Candidatus Binatia bacterium]|jgi:anti-anti-sigma regulatory factor